MNHTVITETTTDADGLKVDEFLGIASTRPWYKRPAIVVAILLAVLLLGLLVVLNSGSEKAGYATETVRRQNLTVTVSATGNLQPTNQVEVGSEQSGLVDRVYVDNNDRVVKGQPLARLDTARLRDTLVQAQATLAAAQAQLSQNQATATQAGANLSRLEEVWRLSGGKVPARTELDTARAERQRAQAGIRAGQAQVAQARAQVSSAQTSLGKATIYSPVTGVVLSRAVDPGQTVAASLQAPVLFTLAEDLSNMELEVKVDEADVGQVRSGQSATFTVDAYPGRTFNAQILRVDLGANSGESTSASGGNVVAYTAVLRVQNADLSLRPGMTATAEITADERSNTLTIPNSALRFVPASAAGGQQGRGVTGMLVPGRPGGSGGSQEASIGKGSRQTVYVLGASGEPEARQVVVGATNGSLTEITSGQLKAGEKVITGQLASSESSAGDSSSSAAPRQAALVGERRVLRARRREVGLGARHA